MNIELEDIAKRLVVECRSQVDVELHSLRESLEERSWTPERAEAIAQSVARDVLSKAVPQIKAELMTDLKISVGEATIGVGKKALQIVGVFVLAAAFWITSNHWPWEK